MVNIFKRFKKCFAEPGKNYKKPLVAPPPRISFQVAPLYVILPYFNYCQYKSRTRLFLEFIKRIYNNPMIRIVIAEGTPKGKPFDLPDFTDKIFLHIKVELHDSIWIKENLINLAIRNLPMDWNYISWIDADLTFMNPAWAQDTIQLLKTYDVVQLFHTAVQLGPEGETLKTDKGFVYQYLKSGHEYIKTSKYGFWHPGFAWACNRQAYVKMNGLIDFGILGSGDHHMALALIQKVSSSHPGGIHLNYQKKLHEYQERCKHFKINYTPGTIIHHFHGSIADRRYQERWNILVRNQYDPETDIVYTKDGILQLSEKGKRLQQPILEYFLGRNEDSRVA